MYPEEIAGKILVKQLLENIKIEEFGICNNLKILKIIADDSMVNESLFNIESLISTVKIISLNNQTKYDPKYKIQKNDSIVFLGENKEIEKLYKSLSF